MAKILSFDEIVAGLTEAKDDIPKQLFYGLQGVADDIVSDMKRGLQMNHAIDTGALYESVRQETHTEADKQESLVYADARSQSETHPVPYAEFLEYGTGIYNEKGNGSPHRRGDDSTFISILSIGSL